MSGLYDPCEDCKYPNACKRCELTSERETIIIFMTQRDTLKQQRDIAREALKKLLDVLGAENIPSLCCHGIGLYLTGDSLMPIHEAITQTKKFLSNMEVKG